MNCSPQHTAFGTPRAGARQFLGGVAVSVDATGANILDGCAPLLGERGHSSL